MKQITLDELKSIQLNILQSVHDYCIENNLRYSICGGTLIGAIRHKGFIPWDDDIDIFMLRSDYEKFVKGFSHKQGFYVVHSLETDKQYCYPYAKVEDARTLIDENVAGPKMGVAVDVFPVDNCYDTKEKSLDFIKRSNWYKTLYRAKLLKSSARNSVFKKVGLFALKMVTCFFSLRYLAEKVSSFCQSALYNSKYVATSVAGYGTRELLLRSFFEDFVVLPFESYSFIAIKEYDFYLQSLYGDYMKLPPEDQRHSPHTINGMYWK